MRTFCIISCLSLFITLATANDLLCLLNSATLGASPESPMGVILDTFDILLDGDITATIETLCGDSPGDCDLTGTDVYNNATSACDVAGGKLILDDLAICSRSIMLVGSFTEPVPPDVSFKNVPICLDTSCRDDIKVFEVVDSFLASGALNIDALEPFKVILDEENCKFPEVDESTGTSKASALGPSMIGSGLALAIALFAI